MNYLTYNKEMHPNASTFTAVLTNSLACFFAESAISARPGPWSKGSTLTMSAESELPRM
jgi:hypothetical protein